MAYVTLEDYSLSVSNQELTDILQQASDGYSLSETQVREKCEAKAESKINNFLSSKYNLKVEFIKTGTARNMQLVGVYIDLTLCAIYKSVSPDDLPEMRQENCKNAIETLEDWRDGKIDLTGVDEIAGAVSEPIFSGPIKFISKPDADPLVTDPEIEQIDAPTDLVLDSVISTQADLSLTSNSSEEESGFEYQRGADAINFLPIAIVPKGIVVYVDTTVVSGTTYYYRAKALGNETKSDSDFTNELTVVVP